MTHKACCAPLAPLPGRRLAAPSWVIPASLQENCLFLSGRVDEVGLLFFETKASLAYSDAELPLSLAALPLSFHLHLPLDLPWDEPAQSAAICLELVQKSSWLRDGATKEAPQPPHCRAVLHPPTHDPADSRRASRALERFARVFQDGGGQCSLLLLENLHGNDLTQLVEVIAEQAFEVCLDTGHMLAYGQEHLSRNDFLLERTKMLHLCAPGPKGREGSHLPLTALNPAGLALCERLIREAPGQSVLMAELFDWGHIERSLPLLRSWLLPQA